MRYEFGTKPMKCPVCGSLQIAIILYGLPLLSEELKSELRKGRITLGGCCITNDDPVWRCLDCNTDIYLMGNTKVKN